uniref:Uncharacterized protein n=1 Tax=Anguilla anguilla TaxID=7936 RepID=A0A0E9W5R8_ANGAN
MPVNYPRKMGYQICRESAHRIHSELLYSEASRLPTLCPGLLAAGSQ